MWEAREILAACRIGATCLQFFELIEEGGSGMVVVEVGKTAVATEGDEVIVAEGGVTLQFWRHRV